jgi:hypothetical protein
VYGPRGSYSFFAGRDASRAYVTGCFETHLTHDVRGLTIQELQVWAPFVEREREEMEHYAELLLFSPFPFASKSQCGKPFSMTILATSKSAV